MEFSVDICENHFDNITHYTIALKDQIDKYNIC